MSKLIHLTDLLFSFNVKLAETKFFNLLEQLRYFHKDASVCVLTGDIVDDDHDNAYKFVFDGLKTLPFPVFVVAGNHDERKQLECHATRNIICKSWKNFIQYT